MFAKKAEKTAPQVENAEKQETLLTLSILTLAAILCKFFHLK